jgi:hypothetical protein
LGPTSATSSSGGAVRRVSRAEESTFRTSDPTEADSPTDHPSRGSSASSAQTPLCCFCASYSTIYTEAYFARGHSTTTSAGRSSKAHNADHPCCRGSCTETPRDVFCADPFEARYISSGSPPEGRRHSRGVNASIPRGSLEPTEACIISGVVHRNSKCCYSTIPTTGASDAFHSSSGQARGAIHWDRGATSSATNPRSSSFYVTTFAAISCCSVPSCGVHKVRAST